MTVGESRTAAHGLRRAHRAVAAVFGVHGAVTGSFAARIPWLQEHSSLSPGQLGLALAFPAVGAAMAMPLAGRVNHRLGARRALRLLLALWTASLVLPGLASGLVGLCTALFVYGAVSGLSDVAMNALGVETENRLGRSIMSGLHGRWSVGALAGSAAGALAAHVEMDAPIHHALAATLLTAAGLIACRGLLDLRSAPDAEPPPRFAAPPRAALLIGLVGFCAVFAEGAGLDWSAVYLGSVLHASPGLAAASTTAFALTMAVARLLGDRVVDRFGPVPTVRAGGVLAALGGVLVVWGGQPATALTGFALIGLGVAVVVPLVFAAAARSGPAPAQALAGVATITYASGLIAPSAIGAVADASSLVVSFTLVTGLTLGLVAGAAMLRRPEPKSGPSEAGVLRP
ncbi:MFS transporter [Streptomyces sp. NPDC006879]|uniref:MFS transporter n=1 Tax=Streptomyces sp. NPDC006879 TaxID=3364767 RepID=UPI0036D034D9